MVKGATLVPTKSCRELLNLYEIDYSVTFTRVSLDFKKTYLLYLLGVGLLIVAYNAYTQISLLHRQTTCGISKVYKQSPANYLTWIRLDY